MINGAIEKYLSCNLLGTPPTEKIILQIIM